MYRIGLGIDIHKFSENRKLIIGGVEIPFHLGLLGHSDADVLIHAIMDALLGAIGEQDIGKHFPDTDKTFKDISSIILLDKVRILVEKQNYNISNIDTMIIAQKPKLAEFIPLMREKISETLNIETTQISIKATTSEYLGFTGRAEGIVCYANALLIKK